MKVSHWNQFSTHLWCRDHSLTNDLRQARMRVNWSPLGSNRGTTLQLWKQAPHLRPSYRWQCQRREGALLQYPRLEDTLVHIQGLYPTRLLANLRVRQETFLPLQHLFELRYYVVSCYQWHFQIFSLVFHKLLHDLRQSFRITWARIHNNSLFVRCNVFNCGVRRGDKAHFELYLFCISVSCCALVATKGHADFWYVVTEETCRD